MILLVSLGIRSMYCVNRRDRSRVTPQIPKAITAQSRAVETVAGSWNVTNNHDKHQVA